MLYKKYININVFDSTIFKTSRDKKILHEPEDCQIYINSICDNRTNAFIIPCYKDNYVTIHVEGDKEHLVDNVMLFLRTWVNTHYIKEIFQKNDKLFIVDNLQKKDYTSNMYPNYFDLLKQLTSINPKNITNEDFDNFVDNLNKNNFIKVIKYKHTQQIVGSITVLKEQKLIHDLGKVAHIEDVIVDKSMRGCGLGKKLIEFAVKECQDCYKIILDCSDENVEFYKKCGFEWKGNQLAMYK